MKRREEHAPVQTRYGHSTWPMRSLSSGCNEEEGEKLPTGNRCRIVKSALIAAAAKGVRLVKKAMPSGIRYCKKVLPFTVRQVFL